MTRDSRYDILFEPVSIGPVTAPNRFFSVPHCSGLGYRFPNETAQLRGTKAEGGWGVVCTEFCEIHPSSEALPYYENRLWDDSDIPRNVLVVDAVHKHGSLAGVELGHAGLVCANPYSRQAPLGPSSVANLYPGIPTHSKAMDKSDIKDLRRWHREASLRARKCGFDVVYVYAGHNLSVLQHFISRRYNHRTDEYGGSLENRARLLREIVEDTKEAIGDTCAVALRFSVDEVIGDDGITFDNEGREVVEMLAELPDLWDVNVSDFSNDALTSRFGEEGSQEHYISFVKKVTTKPVVGVGRFTSPDTMLSQINRGILDFIGAARPSIADPFLPRKIEEGRSDDIRECIGCNICVSGDMSHWPMRCTQNPTIGEEWRRGWHPEKIGAKNSDDTILVVGAGPAGLEAACALGRRGYTVTLAEASDQLGGRVTLESRMPGLSAWARVRDYREHQLSKLSNVEIYRSSSLTTQDVLDFGFSRVVIATGAKWRRDGIGPSRHRAIPCVDESTVFTPDDVMNGAEISGPVIVFDDDHYYMGGVLAEKLRRGGLDVTLVTPHVEVSHWTQMTLEQAHVVRRLVELGIGIETVTDIVSIGDREIEMSNFQSGKHMKLELGSSVLVTARLPDDRLFQDLNSSAERLADAGIVSLDRIGDCEAPGIIAAAIHAGHCLAREYDESSNENVPFAREPVTLP